MDAPAPEPVPPSSAANHASGEADARETITSNQPAAPGDAIAANESHAATQQLPLDEPSHAAARNSPPDEDGSSGSTLDSRSKSAKSQEEGLGSTHTNSNQENSSTEHQLAGTTPPRTAATEQAVEKVGV